MIFIKRKLEKADMENPWHKLAFPNTAIPQIQRPVIRPLLLVVCPGQETFLGTPTYSIVLTTDPGAGDTPPPTGGVPRAGDIPLVPPPRVLSGVALALPCSNFT